MISNNCNNFSVDGGIPQENGQFTSHHARMWCTVHFCGEYLHPSKNYNSHSLYNHLIAACNTDFDGIKCLAHGFTINFSRYTSINQKIKSSHSLNFLILFILHVGFCSEDDATPLTSDHTVRMKFLSRSPEISTQDAGETLLHVMARDFTLKFTTSSLTSLASFTEDEVVAASSLPMNIQVQDFMLVIQVKQ